MGQTEKIPFSFCDIEALALLLARTQFDHIHVPCQLGAAQCDVLAKELGQVLQALLDETAEALAVDCGLLASGRQMGFECLELGFLLLEQSQEHLGSAGGGDRFSQAPQLGLQLLLPCGRFSTLLALLVATFALGPQQRIHRVFDGFWRQHRFLEPGEELLLELVAPHLELVAARAPVGRMRAAIQKKALLAKFLSRRRARPPAVEIFRVQDHGKRAGLK